MRRGTAAATVITAAAALVTAWRAGGTAGQPGNVPGVHVVGAPPSASSTHQPASRSGSSGSRSSTRTTAPATKRTITGAVVSTPYGDVQVAAVVKGTRLLDVKALHLTDANGTSRSISAAAAPQLHDEALQAQSANIDTVSGATYTSEGYRQSLQAALDAAHL
ncbi:MAG TPA: FMN-binding protein [Angustibacter sp.]|nr:FMN-binding protein [Angustibacter sp.]